MIYKSAAGAGLGKPSDHTPPFIPFLSHTRTRSPPPFFFFFFFLLEQGCCLLPFCKRLGEKLRLCRVPPASAASLARSWRSCCTGKAGRKITRQPVVPTDLPTCRRRSIGAAPCSGLLSPDPYAGKSSTAISLPMNSKYNSNPKTLFACRIGMILKIAVIICVHSPFVY